MRRLEQLKRRAKKHDMWIRKNGEGFMLVDMHTNGVVSYPSSMTLDAIEEWLA